MTYGVTTDLPELIALQRYAQRVCYPPQQGVRRAGNHLSRLRGRGMDFAEVRNYQAGDEIRHMEWRVTARTGRPHVKLYQEERERPVMMLTDFNPSMYFGTRVAFKSVIAARLSAILAWTVMNQGDRVGGLLFSATDHHEFMPRSRKSGVLPLLAGLSHYTQTGLKAGQSQAIKPLSYPLLRMRRVIRPGSIIVLMSDFYALDEESEQHLSRLRTHNDVLVYHLCDPLELSPPKPQQYAITDGQEELLLDTRNFSVNQAYFDYCAQRLDQLQAQFKRLQIQYTQVTPDMDLALLIRQTFPWRTHVS